MKIHKLLLFRNFRHFLICNQVARETLKAREGIDIPNFATLIMQERNGVTANAQMTAYFWGADNALAPLSELNTGYVFDVLEDVLEDLGYDIATIAALSEAELLEGIRSLRVSILLNTF